MTHPFVFDFSVHKENKTIQIRRDFAADVATVWAAWTTPELLDKWWAPKPFRIQTKSMDFKVGGHWLYGMVSPEGVIHWSRTYYKTIDPLKSYSGLDAFCDEAGNINPAFPSSSWTNRFQDNATHTTVHIQLVFQTLTDLEKLIELGFKEGFTAILGNLDELLVSL